MFALTDHIATFKHFSNYTEKHGKEEVNGLALKFETAVPAAQLEQFAAGLLGSIYAANGLRFPRMGPLSWTTELVGATVTIDGDDLFGDRKLEFAGAKVDKFVLKPLEGGSVQVTLRAKVQPEPDQVATLFELQHKDVQLTIDPAKASEQSRDPDLVDEAEDADDGEAGET